MAKKKVSWQDALDEMDASDSFFWGAPLDVWQDVIIDPTSFEWEDKDDTHKYRYMTVETSLDGGENFEVEEIPFWMRKELIAFLKKKFDGDEDEVKFSFKRTKDGNNNEGDFRT